MVFPEPGGPINITLCPPAAAISSDLFMFSCSFTSRDYKINKYKTLIKKTYNIYLKLFCVYNS